MSLGQGLFLSKNFNVIEEINKIVEHQFLTDPKITEDLKGYDYLFSKFNISDCCRLLIKWDEEILLNNGFNLNQSKIDNPCTNYFISNRNPPCPTSYLDDELGRKSKFDILKLKVQCGELNLYLIDLLLKIQKDENCEVKVSNLLLNGKVDNEL